jgi:uncharacterized membrane protein
MNTNISPSLKMIQRVVTARSRHHVATSLVVGIVTFTAIKSFLELPETIAIAWDAFAFSCLVLAWGGMLAHGAKARVQNAQQHDSSRATIASCLILAALTSLATAGILLEKAKMLHEAHVAGFAVEGHVILVAVTVVLSWVLVHTLLAIHYAHLFYSGTTGDGLEFPGEKAPDFFDFAYFSFVIGMTFQVSDVQITSRVVRRIALLHSLLSFAFNTVIVAFSINLATALL